MDVDIKSASMQHVKDCRENMDNIYYYVMRDSVILYQQDDNGLYEFLKKAHMFLGWSYSDTQDMSTGFDPYVVIKQSLGAVFLAGYIPMPASMSSLQNISKQLPIEWKVLRLCNENELTRITKNVKPIINLDNDKDSVKSYKTAKKIYESVLNECIERNLLSADKIEELLWIEPVE